MTSKAEELRYEVHIKVVDAVCHREARDQDSIDALIDVVDVSLQALADYAKSLEVKLADRKRGEWLDTFNAIAPVIYASASNMANDAIKSEAENFCNTVHGKLEP